MSRICKVQDCTNKILAKGFCSKHYQRNLRRGSPEITINKERGYWQQGKLCEVPGCEGVACHEVTEQHLCDKHYHRALHHGSPEVLLRREMGTGSITKDGHIITMRDGISQFEHRFIAEKALGHSLPSGAVVHHIDGNPGNNARNNLVICPDDAYHKLLHTRQNNNYALGVHPRDNGTWVIHFRVNEKVQHFGTAYTFEAACNLAITVRKKYGLLAGFWKTTWTEPTIEDFF